jgi:hypothetical protein
MKNFTCILLIVFAFGCKKPFSIETDAKPESYLVVEGTINSANTSIDSTLIKLSRTISVSAAAKTIKAETRAVVSIEDGQGYSFTLREISGGRYVSGPLGLSTAKKYRLRIKTVDNNTYLSDMEPVVYTPPIDSIGYNVLDNGIQYGLQIYANTHNPNDNTRYYRWDFSETWKFHAAYQSKYIVSGGKIIPRPDDQQIYYCYSSAISNYIAISSSAKLTKDVIYQAPITQIPATSEKISLRYSILLKQYGLTQEAFKFWELLKKNTESIGSIFDAQPSQINGNIHCITNPAEIVFGYISITNVQTKRVYIDRFRLPSYFPAGTSTYCKQDTALFRDLRFGKPAINTVNKWIIEDRSLLPVDSGRYYLINDADKTLPHTYNEGFTAAPVGCVDCTLRGVLAKPTFWVDYQ